MLAKIAPLTNDFQTVARYLVHGKSGARHDPSRVAWIISQNLPTDDPQLAAKYMAATAQMSARTKNAAYHLMIAWHANERPTPEAMQNVALQTLELAELAEHQALIMGHGDKPHPHLHILLNRVHPDTGRAWKTSHDFAVFDRIIRELSETHGFAFAPAHTYNPEDTAALPKKPNSAATYAAKRGATTNRPQWSRNDARALGKKLSEDLSAESTTDDLVSLLESEGLAIEPKGKGYVVGNAQGYAKFSRLALEASAHGFARQRHAIAPLPRTPINRRRVFDVDGVDITRALITWGVADREDLDAAIEDVVRQRQATMRNTATASTMLVPTILRSTRPLAPKRSRPQARDDRNRRRSVPDSHSRQPANCCPFGEHLYRLCIQ
jgi:hypothetical protein